MLSTNEAPLSCVFTCAMETNEKKLDQQRKGSMVYMSLQPFLVVHQAFALLIEKMKLMKSVDTKCFWSDPNIIESGIRKLMPEHGHTLQYTEMET